MKMKMKMKMVPVVVGMTRTGGSTQLLPVDGAVVVFWVRLGLQLFGEKIRLLPAAVVAVGKDSTGSSTQSGQNSSSEDGG
mmetsp:Transcript_35026/g.68779  ORF Transcript_35026/g.68779 Transcript_35026/m.68779 type:complete len:80 (-) Transcript_35026:407-646(-)